MKRYLIGALIVLIGLIFLATIPLQKAVVFQANQSTNQLAYILVKDELAFKIKYTHSIHLSDVVESYQITPLNEIQQYELMYEDFSIGMPANAEEGETFEQLDGKYYIRNMNRKFSFFHLRIGQVIANHRVIYKEKEYLLSESLRPGISVKVEIRKLNIFQQWKGVNILESE